MNAAQLAAAGTHAGAGLAVGPAVGIGTGLLLVGIAIGAALMRTRAVKGGASRPASRLAPAAGDGGTSAQPGIDDPALVRSLISLDERARGAAWQPLVAAALSACGIVADYPLNEAFDASRHHAVDTDATTDPAKDMTICAIERPGYLRCGECLSPADVIVLRYRPGHGGGGGR